VQQICASRESTVARFPRHHHYNAMQKFSGVFVLSNVWSFFLSHIPKMLIFHEHASNYDKTSRSNENDGTICSLYLDRDGFLKLSTTAIQVEEKILCMNKSKLCVSFPPIPRPKF
jgi:hypothetical protein